MSSNDHSVFSPYTKQITTICLVVLSFVSSFCIFLNIQKVESLPDQKVVTNPIIVKGVRQPNTPIIKYILLYPCTNTT